MLFNSMVFVLFFLLVYPLYGLLNKRLRVQNVLLLAGSYVFYGWWDWRFLGLLVISTVLDFLVALGLVRLDDPRKRKRLLLLSLIGNLGILGFFKYYNFFADSAARFLHLLGFQADAVTLHIILPIGISFYTFQTLGYTIDVYRRRLPATHSLVDFALFVAFFPQLVAGPIERAGSLLGQVRHRRIITAAQVQAGLFLLLVGYCKKVVIADQVAPIANAVFAPGAGYHGVDAFLGILAFTVQIYGDFSGYSDIARGLAKLLGFELMVNFHLPYFALTPREFWRRWHISLSTWLRDYLYIPLGGNKSGHLSTSRNLMLTMLIGGLWHGAAWHFVVWGGYHGLLLVITRPFRGLAEGIEAWRQPSRWPMTIMQWGLMLAATMVGWTLFRAPSVGDGVRLLSHLGLATSATTFTWMKELLIALPLVVLEGHQYVRQDLLAPLRSSWWVRAGLLSGLFLLLCAYGIRSTKEFIYFQF